MKRPSPPRSNVYTLRARQSGKTLEKVKELVKLNKELALLLDDAEAAIEIYRDTINQLSARIKVKDKTIEHYEEMLKDKKETITELARRVEGLVETERRYLEITNDT